MGIWQRLFRKEEKRELTFRDADGWRTLLGLNTAAGITVTPENAMGHPAVMGAVRLIAELTASLPLIVYERTAGGKQRAENHPVYKLLHEQPNQIQSPFQFKETVALHLLLYGNSYILPEYGQDGRPYALWPIHPSKITLEQDTNGAISYKLSLPSGIRNLTPDEVVHTTMLSMDGLTGKSPVLMARESIGAALAEEEFAAGFFGNAARPSGVLKTDGILDTDAAKRLKESWQQAYGRGKQGTAILEDGLEFEPISADAEKSQLLESRQFAMRAIAAALRIPAHLLDPTARGTYSNVETQSLEFLTFSLQPFLTRLEETFSLKLFTPTERQRYFVEFLTDGLLRVDTRTRFTAYKMAIDGGWMTINEVRRKENLPSIPQVAETIPVRQAGGVEIRVAKVQVINKHKPVVLATVKTAIAKEKAKVLALAEEHLGTRDLTLLESTLSDYYGDPSWLIELFGPVFYALSLEAHSEASKEVAKAPWEKNTLEDFINVQVAAYAAKHAGISLATLQPALRAGSEEAVLEAIETTFINMEATRPGKVAELEIANIANETTLRTYQEAGITKITWRANAGACDFCKRLNGKVVGIGEPFVAAGESIPGPQGDMSRKLTARFPRIRPPMHMGCACHLDPVQEG